MKQPFFLIIIFSFFINHWAYSQKDTIPKLDIDEVVIHAVRLPEKPINLPISVTSISYKNDQNNKQQLSLNEYLSDVPGLFALNANNFAQDLRVSIRGFGARSSFGIRGVKIIVDGIPETTPDGQGQIDNLNLEIINKIDVIRGPSSSLYGNASGGVINITTQKEVDKSFIQFGTTIGSFNMQKHQLTAGIKLKKTSILLLGSHTSSDGYRERSGFENSNFNARILHRISKKATINTTINYANSPKAEDAGGLKLEDVFDNRKQARDRNVLFTTGERIKQFKLATSYEFKKSKNQIFKSYGFYSTRHFYGKLPFEFGGIIDLNRDYLGQGSSYQLNQNLVNGINKIQIGYEFAFQKDNRHRYKSLEGVQGGLTFNQIEKFTNYAVYFLDHLNIGKWNINGGLRFDWNQLIAKDLYLENGDNSGSINLNNLNPSLGISYLFNSENSIYTNFSTSFETPSLSELSSNPSGEEGLNKDLKAQKSKNYELGWKARLHNTLNIGMALFHINTDNEIIPYELAAFPDRKFYQNAGSSTRDGFELEVNYPFLSYWKMNLTYTYSKFFFDQFLVGNKDYSNNQLPGIPQNMASINLRYHNKNGLHFQLNGNYNGALYTNNSNTTEVDDYFVLNTSISYKINRKNLKITPYFGINNILNFEYYDNIRINGFGNRFYEPAPNRNFYGGVKVRINK